jgi:hypothetical protein
MIYTIYTYVCIRNHSSNLLFEKGNKNGMITKKHRFKLGGILLHRNIIYPVLLHTVLAFHGITVVLIAV